MVAPTTIVAGVFSQEAQARRALDALKNDGFDYDQIGVASRQQTSANLLQEFQALGVPQDRASYYNQEYQAGRIVVSVRPDGREQEALSILRSNGGYDYDQRTAAAQTTAHDHMSSTHADTHAHADTHTHADTHAHTDVEYGANDFYQPRSLKLREEQLNVGKERVQTGEVELHKEVVEEQQTINVPVTHEEVYIERRPVSGGQADATPIGEDETISVPVSEEQVHVHKNTVVTGEVAIGKRAVEETQQVTDTVKREEVSIEQEGNAPIHRTPNDPFHPGETDPELVKEIRNRNS